jgi:hypothetical protein
VRNEKLLNLDLYFPPLLHHLRWLEEEDTNELLYLLLPREWDTEEMQEMDKELDTAVDREDL